MNNRIILSGYYVQLSRTLCEQLRTIVHKVSVFSTIVQTYETQWQGVAKHYYKCQNFESMIPRSHQYINWPHHKPPTNGATHNFTT